MTIEKLEIGDLVRWDSENHFAIVKESPEARHGKFYANYELEDWDDPESAIIVEDQYINQF